jgi:hypothetical protein
MEQTLLDNQIISETQLESVNINTNNRFIESNTQQVGLTHLKQDCIIPVFAKDNESTIAHYEFIEAVREVTKLLYPNHSVTMPNIRVSHIVKGRIPSAIRKPANQLKEHEKTIYYERMAFMIEIPEIATYVCGNRLNLTIGGVRSYSEQNLFSKKTLEKFKLFIGFKNMVCCNLCIATDGLIDNLRLSSVDDIRAHTRRLILDYDHEKQASVLNQLQEYTINQEQFAHLVGKMKLYNQLDALKKQDLFDLQITDAQINSIIKNYASDNNFRADENGYVNLWQLYNLFTESAKSNYIDNFLVRNCNTYEFIEHLSQVIKANKPDYFLQAHEI